MANGLLKMIQRALPPASARTTFKACRPVPFDTLTCQPGAAGARMMAAVGG